jgi:hypothetical protein
LRGRPNVAVAGSSCGRRCSRVGRSLTAAGDAACGRRGRLVQATGTTRNTPGARLTLESVETPRWPRDPARPAAADRLLRPAGRRDTEHVAVLRRLRPGAAPPDRSGHRLPAQLPGTGRRRPPRAPAAQSRPAADRGRRAAHNSGRRSGAAIERRLVALEQEWVRAQNSARAARQLLRRRDTRGVQVFGPAFAAAIRRVGRAAAWDEEFPVLGGVLVETTGEELRLVPPIATGWRCRAWRPPGGRRRPRASCRPMTCPRSLAGPSGPASSRWRHRTGGCTSPARTARRGTSGAWPTASRTTARCSPACPPRRRAWPWPVSGGSGCWSRRR